MPAHTPHSPRIPVRNPTAEPIPFGGAVRLLSADADGVFTVAKPDRDSDPGVWTVVSPGGIAPNGGTGEAVREPLGVVAYDPASLASTTTGTGTSTTPPPLLPGDPLGSRAGSWLLKRCNTGFTVRGGVGGGAANAEADAYPQVVAVEILGARAGNGFYPGKIVRQTTSSTTTTGSSTTGTSTTGTSSSTSSTSSTTSTTGTTTTTCVPVTSSTTSTTGTGTTTTGTTTTTCPPLPAGCLFQPPCVGVTCQDAWVLIKDTDMRSVDVGDVVTALVTGTWTDGLPVCLVSYACGGSATTTTPAPCVGRCKWTFDFSACRWSLSSNCCMTPGCSCAPPTFCPADGSNQCVTTYTSCDHGTHDQTVQCPQCPKTSTTSTSSTTTGTGTTSSTTTTCDPCAPFCGGTSTTPTSTTGGPTTTTTLPPQCDSGCTWTYTGSAWVVSSDGCSGVSTGPCSTCGGCCPLPADVAASRPSPCTKFGTGCCASQVICPGPPPPCTGKCWWMCYETGGGWALVQETCAGGMCGCGCDAPSFPCPACGAAVVTDCYGAGANACAAADPCDPCPTYQCGDCPSTTNTTGTGTTGTSSTSTTRCPTTTPTTTTTIPPNCGGQCTWKWVGTGWQFLSNNCPNCTCNPPATSGGDGCEQAASPCGTTGTSTSTSSTTTGTSTTTTSSTSSTTTTTCAPCGSCTWQSNGSGGWTLVQGCSSTASCTCACLPPPRGMIAFAGQVASVACQLGTTGTSTTATSSTTSTSTSSTTTTTCAPCGWLCCCGVCSLLDNGCYTCPDPAGACSTCGDGAGYFLDLIDCLNSGCGSTTSGPSTTGALTTSQ